MKFTKNEQAVYNLIAGISYDGSVADIQDLVKFTHLDAKQARGVISSLVKKDMILVDEFENAFEPVQIHYWPITRKYPDQLWGSFWSDYLTDAEYKAELIEDWEVQS